MLVCFIGMGTLFLFFVLNNFSHENLICLLLLVNLYWKDEFQLYLMNLMCRDLTEATLTGGSLSLTAAFMIAFLLVAVCFV